MNDDRHDGGVRHWATLFREARIPWSPWTASTGVVSLVAALNASYVVEDSRPWWRRRLVAIVLTVALSLFTVVVLLLLVVGPPIAGAVAASLGLGRVFTALWEIVSWAF